MSIPAEADPGHRASSPPSLVQLGQAGEERPRRTSAHRRLNYLQRRRLRVKRRRARRREKRARRHTIFGRHPVASGSIVAVLALSPVWLSLGNAMTNPSFGVTLPARFAEWAREHGAAPLIGWIENFYYSHNPPRVGGAPPKGAIPLGGVGNRTVPVHAAGVTPLPVPAPIRPFASSPLPGEGQWHAAGRLVDGVPAIYEAFLRPDAVHTSYVVGVAWMDTRLLRATLYSGSMIPGGGPYRYTAPVQPGAASSLVAAFNAGFLMSNADGGYYTQGRTIFPLRTGAASFVIYRDGSVAIGAWGSQVRMTSQVVAVRQNLNMLVDNGKPVAGLNPNDISVWGATLGAQVYVWRSAIGVTANGALVYVGGPSLNITTLAALLVRAGAVRGMELDINTDWVDFATFKPSTANGLASPANGQDLLANMVGSPSRYFASWWARDFFTMSCRGSCTKP